MSGFSRALRAAVSRVREAFRGQELVGTDKHGNKYYRWTERAGGNVQERRRVEVPKGHVFYDPKTIPSEWRMWLLKTREEPPTMEELAQAEAKAEVMRRKVAALEEQERIRRFRAQATGAAGPSAPAGSFMEQLAGKMSEDSKQGS